MKIALIVLSGSESRARELALADYPSAEIAGIPRDEFRRGSSRKALARTRSLSPAIFRVHCRLISTQPRVKLLLLFGLLSGARNAEVCGEDGAKEAAGWWTMLIRILPSLAIEMIGAAWLVLASWFAVSWFRRRALSNAPSSRTLPANPAKRILYLLGAPLSLSAEGGARSHVEGFISGAKKLGWETTLVTADDLGPEIARLCRQVVVGPSEFFSSIRDVLDLANHRRMLSAARGIAGAESYDFIYQRYSRLNWAGAVLSREFNKILVLEFNGSEVWIARHWDSASLWKLLARAEELAIFGADRVAVTSDPDRENLLARGIPPGRILVNENGVDHEVFRPGCGGERLRQELGIDREVVIGYIASFGPWHGSEILARAAAQLSRRDDLRFLFMGDGVLRPRAEQIVAGGGAERSATFTGSIPHSEVPRYLDACDILASPHVPNADGSEFFGSPTKLFEYLSMGKAIVASRLGQIGKIIEHEENGLLVAPGDVNELAAAIARLADDAEFRERLGVQARRTAIEKYSWQRNAKTVLDAIRE